MKSKTKRLFLAFALISLSLLMPVFASGTKDSSNTGIFVTGTGTVSLIPDTASISLAVVTLDAEASKAAQMNANLMTKVIEAVKTFEIKDTDIQTSNYNMYQETNYNKDGTRTPGEYRVTNNLQVTVKDVDKAGDVIDAALSAGANQLSSIKFYALETKEAYTQARILAIQQATDIAKTLAQASNCSLGKPFFISEQSNSSYRATTINNNMMLKSDAMVEGTPVSPGSTDISVSVNVRFAIK
ncbi:MAG: hypothetical protein BKP49_10410 [Treponema sp. CETP13]|nr:MAG: hypothetical protein BKP49_10410 [Treponema sp. CETP13]